MFIVIVSYSKSPEIVEPHFKKHCEWLNKHIKLGNFVASGPKKDQLGGAFLACSMNRMELQKILDEDSYSKAGVADYLIVDMDFKLAAPGFEKLIDSPTAQPKKSDMMDALYGKEVSQAVYNRCQELSPDFNKMVQEIVYDVFWRRSGLELKEKSLITMIALITLNKEEQLRIHLGGFFHLGGTPDTILQILNYMKLRGYISSIDKALAILQTAAKEKLLEIDHSTSTVLSEHEKAIVDFAACIAVGDQEKTSNCMAELLKNKIISREEMSHIMLHEMLYCGFPCAMNGFSILKDKA